MSVPSFCGTAYLFRDAVGTYVILIPLLLAYLNCPRFNVVRELIAARHIPKIKLFFQRLSVNDDD